MVTIKDVAKKTGFSTTTVSRALNGHSDVNEETKHIIESAAKELNYIPNLVAQSLVTRKSRTIGLLVAELKAESAKDNFMFEVLLGVNNYVAAKNYEMILLSTDTSKQQNKTLNQLVSERNLDGVIIEGLKNDDPYIKEALNSEIPAVFIDIPLENQITGYVTTDQNKSVKHAIRYFYRLGHRKISFLGGHSHAYVSIERLTAYKEALEELNVEFNEDYVYYGDFAEQIAYTNSIQFLLNFPEVTAIFCASDLMALGVLKACKELNINIPKDLSVIGFDNILLTQYVTPTLTTIAQSPFQIGQRSAELLLDMIHKTQTATHYVLENRLIVRESTGKNNH
ncbi:LacI family DNA-binding transcriptional regulator [Enterococcus sp. DIV0086]|uniref:LacI family DNA-binding transcriptional regulator n=1 Tax=Enterococcus sp. DIV0086 TaxID=2774655 RepID=UPI003D2E833C